MRDSPVIEAHLLMYQHLQSLSLQLAANSLSGRLLPLSAGELDDVLFVQIPETLGVVDHKRRYQEVAEHNHRRGAKLTACN